MSGVVGLSTTGGEAPLNRPKVALFCSVKCPGKLILTTFPLVNESVKQLTLNTYRDMLRLGKLPETRL